MDAEKARMDCQLSERIGSGDDEALGEVYDTYAGAVYGQALAVVGSTADAEDVLQEVFLKLVRRRGLPIRELKAYLLTAARHEACSVLRRRRREAPECDPEAAAAPLPDPAGGTADREAIREALQALPVKQREVVLLKVYEELTFEEIGRRVRASVNTVASRYRYALKKLREALGDAANV